MKAKLLSTARLCLTDPNQDPIRELKRLWRLWIGGSFVGRILQGFVLFHDIDAIASLSVYYLKTTVTQCLYRVMLIMIRCTHQQISYRC